MVLKVKLILTNTKVNSRYYYIKNFTLLNSNLKPTNFSIIVNQLMRHKIMHS